MSVEAKLITAIVALAGAFVGLMYWTLNYITTQHKDTIEREVRIAGLVESVKAVLTDLINMIKEQNAEQIKVLRQLSETQTKMCLNLELRNNQKKKSDSDNKSD